MRSRFVRVYLVSAALILAVTALGKAIPVRHPGFCIEHPILGPLQLGLPNLILLWVASALEFGIVGMICFSSQRWRACLASGVWGTWCLLVRIVFLGTASATSCHCLGWFQHVVPLPTELLNSILLILAAWLAVGGYVSFRWTWHSAGPGLSGQAATV